MNVVSRQRKYLQNISSFIKLPVVTLSYIFLPHVVYFCRAPAYRFANLHIRRILVIFGTYCCIISENLISAAQSFVNLHFCDISVISATR